jgi:ferredoxin
MPKVKFTKEKKEVEVPVGANLRKVAQDSGVNIYHGVNGIGETLNQVFNCHGFGLCGTCAVGITKGMENTNPIGLMEKAKFKGFPLPDLTCLHYIGNEGKLRLACKTQVLGDIEVETGPAFNLFGENFFS